MINIDGFSKAMKRSFFICLFLTCSCGSGAIKKWPNGIIRYHLDDRFNDRQINEILDAVEYLNSKTNISFRLEEESGDYVCEIMRDASENMATVGMYEDCWVKLSDTSLSMVVHEFLHVAGLQHEHQRPDRNKWITINTENIIENRKKHFKIRHDTLYDTSNIPYDCRSIMHYESHTFSKNGLSTIDFNCGSSGYRPESAPYNDPMTALDIIKVNFIYPNVTPGRD